MPHKSREEKNKRQREYYKSWYPQHRLDQKLRTKLNMTRYKMLVIRGYGGKCECCGEHRTEFLSIDHINGGGNQARKDGKGSYALYRWLTRNDYPRDKYRLLCMNCNSSLGFHGYCPHNLPFVS